MKHTQTEENETRSNFDSRTMIPRTREECDIAACDAEYACGLMGWARRDEDLTDWTAIESASAKAFNEYHKLGPQSAQY